MSARRKRVISTEEMQFNHKPAKMLLTEKKKGVSQNSQTQGCTKLKSAWELNFNINFGPDFHAILMLSGKAQNNHFILSNTYIHVVLKMRTDFFTTLKWIRKLSFDDYYEQRPLLIAKGTLQNNLIKESWKKEQNPGCWLRKKLQVTDN